MLVYQPLVHLIWAESLEGGHGCEPAQRRSLLSFCVSVALQNKQSNIISINYMQSRRKAGVHDD